MSELTLLLALKLKHYFGPVRLERRRLLLSLLQFLVLGGIALPWGFLLAREPAAAPLGGPEGAATTALSVFLALGLLSAYTGGVTATPAEIDFVLPSPLRPRTILHASVLFQLVVVQLTTLPFFPLLVGFALGRGLPAAWPLLAALGYEGFLLFSILAAHALGLLVVTGRGTAKLLVAALVALLLLPVLGLLVPFPRYGDLPLPSTLYVDTLLLLTGKPTRFPWAPGGLAAYLLLAYAGLRLAGRRNFLPHLRPNQALAFGERVHPGLLRERLGARPRPPRRPVGDLRPATGSLPRLLLRLHLLRLLRERGVLVALGSLLVVALMPALLAGPGGAGPQFLTSAVLYTALLGPMLTTAWNGGERANLWIPLTSPGGRAYFQGLFLALVLAALALPAPLLLASLALLGPPPAWQAAALPLIALASCGLALLLALRRPLPAGASPGLGPLGAFVLPVLGSYLISAPALGTEAALALLGPGPTAALLAAYTAAVALGLWRAVGRAARRVRA